MDDKLLEGGEIAMGDSLHSNVNEVRTWLYWGLGEEEVSAYLIFLPLLLPSR